MNVHLRGFTRAFISVVVLTFLSSIAAAAPPLLPLPLWGPFAFVLCLLAFVFAFPINALTGVVYAVLVFGFSWRGHRSAVTAPILGIGAAYFIVLPLLDDMSLAPVSLGFGYVTITALCGAVLAQRRFPVLLDQSFYSAAAAPPKEPQAVAPCAS